MTSCSGHSGSRTDYQSSRSLLLRTEGVDDRLPRGHVDLAAAECDAAQVRPVVDDIFARIELLTGHGVESVQDRVGDVLAALGGGHNAGSWGRRLFGLLIEFRV